MKLIVTAVVLTGTIAIAGAALRLSAQSNTVMFVGHDKVAEAIAKGGGLVSAPNLAVSGNHRAGPGQVEVHDKETDVLYIIEGQATFVTGGTMVGGKQTAPGQHRGSDIQGGETRHLQKGDVVMIPAGVPHWFKEVSPTVNYFTVKVIK
jgi:mannose-6-phosphate isomerase-like protein (cupin superfamily)